MSMELDPIHKSALEKVQESLEVSEDESDHGSLQVDSGLSSIEKSKAVRPEIIPMVNIPILSSPNDDETHKIEGSSQIKSLTNKDFNFQLEEIKHKVLDGWSQNLREIAEQVKQLLSSPIYQQIQEIQHKGHSSVNGIVTISNDPQTQLPYFSAVTNHLEKLKHISNTSEAANSSKEEGSSQAVVLSLTAALLAGGLVIGIETVGAMHYPLTNVAEIVNRLQPLFSQIAVQEIIPVINLMIAAPIYYHSWNEATNNVRNRERQNEIQIAHHFAKNVIKMITDPFFVKQALINFMPGVEKLSVEDQERLTGMLKIVLIGISLSLLYSVEVGKVQSGKYAGIELEELRALLSGQFNQNTTHLQNLSEHQQLTTSLIKRMQEQLQFLSQKDRTFAIEILVDYITRERKLDAIVNPLKVFNEILPSTTFNAKEKMSFFKV